MTTKHVPIEKVVLIRAAHDFAPKVVAAGVGGLSATELIGLLQLAHINLPVTVANLLVALAAAACGWIKADTSLLQNIDKANAALDSSPEAALVTNVANVVRADVAAVAPLIPVVAPVAAPYVTPVKDGIDTITDMLGGKPTVTEG